MHLAELLSLIAEGESERVEFKADTTRDIGREIVALANAEGGHILIGVGDDGGIVGTNAKGAMERIASTLQSVIPSVKMTSRIVDIDDKQVVVLTITKSEVLCSIGGVAHIRIGAGIRPLSIQEVLMLSSEMGTIEWDGAQLLSKGEAKSEYLDWFFERVEETRRKTIVEYDRDRFLRSIGAVKDDKLTNAGVLFFREADEILPQSQLRLVFIERGEPVGSREYTGPVWKIIDDSYADIIREVGQREVVVSTKRRKVGGYPHRVLREALINAVAHRNYAIHADVRLLLASEELTIKNPGGLLPGVNIDDPEHIPRNPRLCNLLYNAGYIERYGYGIRMMREEVEKHAELEIAFKTSPNTFTVALSMNREMIMDRSDEKMLQTLASPAKSSEIARALNISKPTTVKRLKRLVQLGFVKKRGEGPQTRYYIP